MAEIDRTLILRAFIFFIIIGKIIWIWHIYCGIVCGIIFDSFFIVRAIIIIIMDLIIWIIVIIHISRRIFNYFFIVIVWLLVCLKIIVTEWAILFIRKHLWTHIIISIVVVLCCLAERIIIESSRTNVILGPYIVISLLTFAQDKSPRRIRRWTIVCRIVVMIVSAIT